MADQTNKSNSIGEGVDSVLLSIIFDDPAIKNDKATGLKISQAIYNKQVSTNPNTTDLNFFSLRSQRWALLDKWSTGTEDMTEFLDYFNIVGGKTAYAKIDMTPIALMAKYCNTLIESICKNEEYPCVYAIDEYSKNKKEQDKNDALYRMHYQQQIMQLEQMAGINFEPLDAYVPRDKLAADVFFSEEYKIPKEIKYENICAYAQQESDYARIYRRAAYNDLIVKNVEVSKVERQPNGKKTFRRVIPKNCFYNFFLGETGKLEVSYIGECYNIKIKDLRNQFGKSKDNPDGLTEKDLYELAKVATVTNIGEIWRWDWQEQFNWNYRQPWDDYNILVFDYEIRLGDADYYVGKPDSRNNENITPKNGIPNPTSDKAKIYKQNKTTWQRGVYFPRGNRMIYWGKPPIVICPFGDINGLSSYTIVIPNNNGEYVPSIFERALEPAKEHALCKLKRKQLISKVRPRGIKVDVESARNVDLGDGNALSWDEVVRIYDQSGVEVYNSRGVYPADREAPAISQGINDNTLVDIIQLTQTIKECEMEIRGIMGIPIYRDGSDVGERTAAKLAEGQQQSSFNVTDFIPNAHNQCMEETLYKICVLNWQDELREDTSNDADLVNTNLSIKIKMKDQAYERELLENNIQKWSAQMSPLTGLPILLPKDVFRIRNIENNKLAELYLGDAVEGAIQRAEKQKNDAAEQNIESQRATAQDAAKGADELQDKKLMIDMKLQDEENKGKLQGIALQGCFDLQKAGVPLTPELRAMLQTFIPNITMPLAVENRQMQEAVQNESAQQIAQAQQQEQPQQEQAPDEMQQEQQPQQQMQPQ